MSSIIIDWLTNLSKNVSPKRPQQIEVPRTNRFNNTANKNNQLNRGQSWNKSKGNILVLLWTFF